MENFEKIDIEMSSTSLGNTNPEGGKLGAILGLAEAGILRERYTETVVRNVEEAQEITQEIFPNANFGVSVLASSVNPEQMKGFISSVDYPYLVKFNKDFLEEKLHRVKEEGYSGLGLGVALAQEYAYAILQAHSEKSQMGSTVNAASLLAGDLVNIRTCIETISIEDEMRKIKRVNDQLKSNGKNVIWAIEPNRKIGDGSLQNFMEIYENIAKENSTLKFGIDLDFGGLPKEDYRNVLNIMNRLDNGGNLPIYISLSGKDYDEGAVRTHMPLGADEDYNKALGEWIKTRQFRGQEVPALVVETSPTINVLKDYAEFLESFKKGFN